MAIDATKLTQKVMNYIDDLGMGQGGKILSGNNPINPLNNFLGVGEAAVRGARHESNFVQKTFKKNSQELMQKYGNDVDGLNEALKAEKWNYGKIAGSYIGATAAGRVVSGGGLYRDSSGNTNLIGVPFV